MLRCTEEPQTPIRFDAITLPSLGGRCGRVPWTEDLFGIRVEIFGQAKGAGYTAGLAIGCETT
jgi:hypothetical protein